MSLTKVSYSMIDAAPVNVKDYGFSETASAATNTAAITAAAAAINAAGSGTLVFPEGNFNIWGTLPTVPLAAFTSCNGLSIVNQGCVLNVTYAWTGNEFETLFQFNSCKNLHIDVPEIISAVQPAMQRQLRGPFVLEFLTTCENIDIPKIKATGALSVIQFTGLSTDSAATRTKNINIGVGYADRCGYGTTYQFSGDNVFIGAWYSIGPHRSYFPYGVKNHVVNIYSQDQDADDCLLRGYEGRGLNNIQLNYTNVNTTSAQSAAPCVSLAPGDQTPVEFFNININIRASWPASGFMGYGFHLYKNDNGGGYDPTDRGHKFKNIKLNCTFVIAASGIVPLRICAETGWGPGEFIDGFQIQSYTQDGAGSATIGCGSMHSPPQINNVASDGAFYSLAAPSYAAAQFNNCKATVFTSATNDTGYAQYFNCEITDDSIQSIINKTFQNTIVEGRLVTEFPKYGTNFLASSNALSGNLTGTNNIFRVTLGSGGAYFRLSYSLVADASDLDPVTRDVTFGVKSWNATIGSTGVANIVTAVANEVSERSTGTASAVTVTMVNDAAGAAYVAVACTNYNTSVARGAFVLEVIPEAATDTILLREIQPV